MKRPIGAIFYSLFRVLVESPIIILITVCIIGLLIFVILYSEKRGRIQKYYRRYNCRSCGKQFEFDVGRITKLKCPYCGCKDLEEMIS